MSVSSEFPEVGPTLTDGFSLPGLIPIPLQNEVAIPETEQHSDLQLNQAVHVP